MWHLILKVSTSQELAPKALSVLSEHAEDLFTYKNQPEVFFI